ncbi:SgcJ/EcaC family oxidoreductase [Nocardia terpenica]|uniref:SgcJ/EcaC family oxidoreductase n=1 Tax=Nocardia terpenica TaxID=455432 RepID=UPI001893989E|nr:SgcJ/EcaC family oxidoreductase [Nocardia terpenica]MBF6061102.1 SgcJ/EcaC family oxidoreductase [Nocardia terpenica]MBF6105669.1 SgcJ/EcaC family oxidoreductase [Nocardia terpenica]MBF6112861.1 SgcJ/EcaC family oxidoreductase [Nocardia terpenica]MBF6118991.1 SgcJ/EcaC family oxidoreductase [Nocardia terpenica]
MTSSTRSSTLSPENAVRDVLDRAMAAWANNDPDGFTACYADEVSVILTGGAYHRTKSQVHDYMASGFAGPMKGSKGIDKPESIRILGNDAAIVVSLSGFQLPNESEVPEDRLRRATWVLVKQRGEWKITSYHNCPLK